MTAVQLELFKPEPAASQVNDWGVWVNECAIFANGQAADWWATFWLRSHPDRVTCLETSIAGGLHHVACDCREDAELLRQNMIEHGISPKAVMVQRLAAARKATEARRAKFDATTARLAELMAHRREHRPAHEGIDP